MDDRASSRLRLEGVTDSGFAARQLTEAQIQGADLILGFTRNHCLTALGHSPESFAKVFTVREFERAIETTGSASTHHSWWDARTHAQRLRRDGLLPLSENDDIADPFRLRDAAYQQIMDVIVPSIDKLASIGSRS